MFSLDSGNEANNHQTMIKHEALQLLSFSVILFLSSCGSTTSLSEKTPALPEGVSITHTGLKSKTLRPGRGGGHPASFHTVTAHYKGWTTDGKVFDTSYLRGEPSQFPLDQVIPGWTEGLQLMTRGEKRRFWIPAKLAYGDHPTGGQPAGELIFDIELIDFR